MSLVILLSSEINLKINAMQSGDVEDLELNLSPRQNQTRESKAMQEYLQPFLDKINSSEDTIVDDFVVSMDTLLFEKTLTPQLVDSFSLSFGIALIKSRLGAYKRSHNMIVWELATYISGLLQKIATLHKQLEFQLMEELSIEMLKSTIEKNSKLQEHIEILERKLAEQSTQQCQEESSELLPQELELEILTLALENIMKETVENKVKTTEGYEAKISKIDISGLIELGLLECLIFINSATSVSHGFYRFKLELMRYLQTLEFRWRVTEELITACRIREMDCVKIILASRMAYINTNILETTFGPTSANPLLCSMDYPELVTLLLANGANTEVENTMVTPL